MCRRLLLAMLVIITFICSGCFGGHVDLSIDESGAVHSKNTLVGVEFMREELEKQKRELLKDHPNAIVTPVQEGNMSGFSIQMDYDDMDSFAADGVKFYATRPGLCKGIQKNGRWFFDAYALDLFVEGNGELGQDKEAAAMAGALLSQVRFDFTLNLPYAADSHNAETVSNGSKTLSWNIAPSLTRGESRKINATFKIWKKLNIGLTVGIAVLLLAAAAFFTAQASSAQGADRNAKTGLAITAGGALLALGLFSGYLLLAPVKFTDSDIISGTFQSETKQNIAPSGTQPNPAILTPIKPSAPQPRQTAPNPTTQQSRPNTAPAAQNPAGQAPTQTLKAFHQNITNKAYRKAYDCLSRDFQNSMSYEGWASGFQTTVSSTVSDVMTESLTNDKAVLTYILKAVDNPGGTKYFRGTAVLVKTSNGWKIDEITNKAM